MDDGEVLVAIGALVISGVLWSRWFYRVAVVFAPRTSRALRAAVIAAPPLFLTIVAIGLHLTAPVDVKNSPGYITLFTLVAAVTLFVGSTVLRYVGVDILTNGIEGGNLSTVIAGTGAWAGAAALNIGANIGQGAEIYTTLFPLALGVVMLAAFTALVAWCTALPESITGMRSIAAGIRLGSLLLSASLPLAAKASGDWVSASGTFDDLVSSTPALLVLAASGWIVEKAWPPTSSNRMGDVLARGILPALWFAALGFVFAWAPWQ